MNFVQLQVPYSEKSHIQELDAQTCNLFVKTLNACAPLTTLMHHSHIKEKLVLDLMR